MTPKELWDLNIDDFNKWRRENDLPKMFKVFREKLPLFDDWLKENALTVDFMISTNKPGEFFYWQKNVHLVEYEEQGIKNYLFVPIEDQTHEKQLKKIHKSTKDKQTVIKFKPYFLWASEKLATEEVVKTEGSGSYNSFRVITKSAPDVPDLSNSTIVPGHRLLKLGGIKLNSWAILDGRNLDFADFDHLEIDGEFHWSREIKIFYSTFEKIKLRNVEAVFTHFHECDFRQIDVIDTDWYWLEFYDCRLYGANFENSSLRNLILEDSVISRFSFSRTESENIQYRPNTKNQDDGKAAALQRIADNFKRFRTLFQNNGQRKDASEAFYNEKIYELKYNWASLEVHKSFGLIRKKNLRYAVSHFKYHFGLLLEVFVDTSSYLIWGFGEKPSRVLACSGTIMILFALLYYFSTVATVGGDFVNSLYLSIIMFSTLGFGDFTPLQVGTFKLIVALEALTGAFFWGMFISGYANKSRY